LEYYSGVDIYGYEFELKTVNTQFDILGEILYLMIADPIKEFLKPILLGVESSVESISNKCTDKWFFINHLAKTYLSQFKNFE